MAIIVIINVVMHGQILKVYDEVQVESVKGMKTSRLLHIIESNSIPAYLKISRFQPLPKIQNQDNNSQTYTKRPVSYQQ